MEITVKNNKSIDQLIYEMDKYCTVDLQKGLINGERDYVSNLLCYIRKPYGPLCEFSLGTAYTLPNNLEKEYGCDGIIIIRFDDNHAKIAMFESKLPRYISKPNSKWDTLNRKSNSKYYKWSRFTSQLARQKEIDTPEIVLFELFINEAPQHKDKIENFDDFASSCITFNRAWNYYVTEKESTSILWTNSDLKNLLDERKNIGDIMSDMINCHSGIKIPIVDYKIRPKFVKISIPFLNQSNFQNIKEVRKFMLKYGINNYFILDLKMVTKY